MQNLSVNSLLDLNYTIANDLFLEHAYPWTVLTLIREFILKIGSKLDTSVYERFDNDIWAAKNAVIAKSASLSGPLIIDEHAEIRHCAFIRGSVIVGKGAVVGNSTELKNSILFDEVQVPHYNYIGDSILGYKVHTGAGTITSNLKSDRSMVSVLYNGEKIETGMKKFGAVLGNYVEVGCNSVLNPGTIVGKNTIIYPLSLVRGYVPEKSIYKKQSEIVLKK